MSSRSPHLRAAAVAALLLYACAVAAHAQTVITGGTTDHVVTRGESLRSIGARHGVDPATLAADNGLSLTAPLAVGRTLRVDNRHIVPPGAAPDEILVNVPQRMLFYRTGDTTLAFPVAVGRADWRTPTAEFSIVVKEENPTWDVPASIRAEARRAGRELPARVPPGPGNPLGKHWLGLDIGGVGIHGTNAPASIYQAVTHGCMRMHPDDVERLFGLVRLGTRGRIVYHPVLVAEAGGQIYLEAHRDIYRRAGDVVETMRAAAQVAGLSESIDWERATRTARAREGVARVVPRRAGGAGAAAAPGGQASFAIAQGDVGCRRGRS